MKQTKKKAIKVLSNYNYARLLCKTCCFLNAELRARCIVEGRTASSDAAKAACNIVKSTCQPAKLSAEDRPTSVSLIELYGPGVVPIIFQGLIGMNFVLDLGSIETGVNLPCDRLFQQSCTNQARRYIRRNDEDCEGILSRGPSSSTQNCTDVDHALRLLNKELETLCIYS
eukprot:g4460.t1